MTHGDLNHGHDSEDGEEVQMAEIGGQKTQKREDSRMSWSASWGRRERKRKQKKGKTPTQIVKNIETGPNEAELVGGALRI